MARFVWRFFVVGGKHRDKFTWHHMDRKEEPFRQTTTTHIYRGLLNVFVFALLSQLYGPHTECTLCISKTLESSGGLRPHGQNWINQVCPKFTSWKWWRGVCGSASHKLLAALFRLESHSQSERNSGLVMLGATKGWKQSNCSHRQEMAQSCLLLK